MSSYLRKLEKQVCEKNGTKPRKKGKVRGPRRTRRMPEFAALTPAAVLGLLGALGRTRRTTGK